jgi:hypothetical protein
MKKIKKFFFFMWIYIIRIFFPLILIVEVNLLFYFNRQEFINKIKLKKIFKKKFF